MKWGDCVWTQMEGGIAWVATLGLELEAILDVDGKGNRNRKAAHHPSVRLLRYQMASAGFRSLQLRQLEWTSDCRRRVVQR